MKLERLVLIAGVLLLLTACAEKETDTPVSAEPEPPAAETAAPPPMPEAEPPADREAFITHMHVHSIHLDRVNEALDAGDLEAAATPAYWLASHDAVEGLPEGWGPFLEAIRDEARAIEGSKTVDSARAAAKRLAGHCEGCHQANGLEIAL